MEGKLRDGRCQSSLVPRGGAEPPVFPSEMKGSEDGIYLLSVLLEIFSCMFQVTARLISACLRISLDFMYK